MYIHSQILISNLNELYVSFWINLCWDVTLTVASVFATSEGIFDAVWTMMVAIIDEPGFLTQILIVTLIYDHLDQME